MVRLNIEHYNHQELKYLSYILFDIVKRIESQCARNRPCDTCELRHLCVDIKTAHFYTTDNTKK